MVTKLLKYKVLFWLLVAYYFASGSDVDKYNYRLQNARDSLEKVFIYHEIISEIKDSALDEAISYSKEALRLANKIQSPQACGLTNEIIGELFSQNQNIQPAINYYLISAKIFEEIENNNKLSSIYGKLGLLYYENEFDTKKTLEYYQKSLNFAVKANNDTLIGLSYNRIGGLLFNQGNYSEALQYFLKSQKIFEEVNDIRNEAVSLNNAGDAYRQIGNSKQALIYFENSLTKISSTDDLQLKPIIYENMGLTYLQIGDIDKAISFYRKSLASYRTIGNKKGMSFILILMADAYIKTNKTDSAYLTYHEANNLAQKLNDMELLRDSYYGLSRIYEYRNDFSRSLEYLKKYAVYNDTLVKSQMSKRIVDLQSQFIRSINEKEIQIKDSQIDLLKSENKLETLKKNLLILGVITLFAAFLLTWIILRKRIKKQQLINLKDKQLHETQQELLRLDLNSKENDLMTFALHIVQKNDLLKQLKKELGDLSSKTDEELNKKLKKLSAHVQQNLHVNKEIEEFQQKVDSAYDDFFKKLNAKFPFLTKNERRLCVLLRLNLSTKEIASLNNTSNKAVEMSRYRLRKKCGLGNKESVVEYMQNI